MRPYFGGFDRSSAEATRTFWGNGELAEQHNVNGIFISNDSCVPLADLRAMYVAQKQAAEAKRQALPDYTGHDLNIEKMVQTVIGRASDGQRNGLGFWLACRLVENDVPQTEAESAMRLYAEGCLLYTSPSPRDQN